MDTDFTHLIHFQCHVKLHSVCSKHRFVCVHVCPFLTGTLTYRKPYQIILLKPVCIYRTMCMYESVMCNVQCAFIYIGV